jgi:hypothetical protein
MFIYISIELQFLHYYLLNNSHFAKRALAECRSADCTYFYVIPHYVILLPFVQHYVILMIFVLLSVDLPK